MKSLSKSDASNKIEEYFSKDSLNSKETKKIKKLAMAFRISLKKYRKRFCKSCYSDLKLGKVRVSKNYKYVECPSCKKRNAWKIK